MIAISQELKSQLVGSDYVIDKEGAHHEFASGMHGRKIDFDTIPTESDLFELWVEATAQQVRFLYAGANAGELALLSVANGTNRLVGPVAEALDDGTTALLTEKDSMRSVILTPTAKEIIAVQQPNTVVVLDDVGTTGGVAATAVQGARSQPGVGHVDVHYAWQRQRFLEAMIKSGTDYQSLIYDVESYPTYTPEQCRAIGHCAAGWELIERGA